MDMVTFLATPHDSNTISSSPLSSSFHHHRSDDNAVCHHQEDEKEGNLKSMCNQDTSTEKIKCSQVDVDDTQVSADSGDAKTEFEHQKDVPVSDPYERGIETASLRGTSTSNLERNTETAHDEVGDDNLQEDSDFDNAKLEAELKSSDHWHIRQDSNNKSAGVFGSEIQVILSTVD